MLSYSLFFFFRPKHSGSWWWIIWFPSKIYANKREFRTCFSVSTQDEELSSLKAELQEIFEGYFMTWKDRWILVARLCLNQAIQNLSKSYQPNGTVLVWNLNAFKRSLDFVVISEGISYLQWHFRTWEGCKILINFTRTNLLKIVGKMFQFSFLFHNIYFNCLAFVRWRPMTHQSFQLGAHSSSRSLPAAHQRASLGDCRNHQRGARRADANEDHWKIDSL